jgi:hypothetical protein
LALDFASGLDVTLDVTDDAVADGTFQLNSSLAGLADLGIDYITGVSGQDVTLTGGVGSLGDNLLTFAESLNVTVELSDADISTYTGNWSDMATDLSGVGVDVISVGGVADISLSDVTALISEGLSFAATDDINLDVTSVEGTTMGGHSLQDLADLGVDTVEDNSGEVNTINLTAGDTVTDGMSEADLAQALSDILAKFDTGVPVFESEDIVTVSIGDNDVTGLTDLLDEIELLGIDALSDTDGNELWNKTPST